MHQHDDSEVKDQSVPADTMVERRLPAVFQVAALTSIDPQAVQILITWNWFWKHRDGCYATVAYADKWPSLSVVFLQTLFLIHTKTNNNIRQEETRKVLKASQAVAPD